MPLVVPLEALASRGRSGRGQWKGEGTGVLHVSGKLVDKMLHVVYLYVYLNTD